MNPLTERMFSLVDEYAKNKKAFDELKKLCEEQNKELKSLMKELDVADCSTKDWYVKLGQQKRESMNEDMLLDIAHKNNLQIIKVKECIDYDSLENLLYKGEIAKDVIREINKARQIKIVTTLKVAKKKKGN